MNQKIEAFKSIITELKNQNTTKKQDEIARRIQEKYNIPEALIQSFTVRELNDEFFKDIDIRLITLFIIESLKVLKREQLLDELVTEGEVLESKQFDFDAFRRQEMIQLPYDFRPTITVNNVYSTKISVKQISEFLNAGILNYNFDIQREAKIEKRTDKIIKVPTLNRPNIDEMRELLINDALKESTLYFNAAPLTSKNGDELLYDENTFTLRITEGTRLDVIDGYHRVLAAQEAIAINPLIEFEFNVVFSNFTTSEAIKWQAQHSKATPWSKNRTVELQQGSNGAKVVKAIRDKGVHFEKWIQTSKQLHTSIGLISFRSLVDIIDENFAIESRRDEVNVANEVASILEAYYNIQGVNKSFNTHNFVKIVIEAYVKEYNRDLNVYLSLLKDIENYLLNNGLSLRIEKIGGKTKNQIEKEAKEKYDKLIMEMRGN